VRTTFGNLQKEVEIDKARVRKLVSDLAREEGIRGGEVALVFIEDAYIRELKGRYLGVRRATDVLAFPLAEEPRGVAPDEDSDRDRKSAGRSDWKAAPNVHVHDDLLGEIYVSTERAIDQARRNHVGLSEEIARLIVHGLLHLFGHRDDSPSSRRKMIRRQEAFLRENKVMASTVAKRLRGRRKDAPAGRHVRSSFRAGSGSSSV
jgi:probable rRNA maturation factor